MEDKILFATDIFYRYFRFEHDDFESFRMFHYMNLRNNPNREDALRMELCPVIKDTVLTEKELKRYLRYKSYQSRVKLRSIEMIIEIEDYLKENGYKSIVNRVCYVLKTVPNEVYEPSYGFVRALNIVKNYNKNWEDYKNKLIDDDKKSKAGKRKVK